MMKQNNSIYSRINSFQDFENEKLRLRLELKLAEKNLEIKGLELGVYYKLIKKFPVLMSEWLTPLMSFFKNSAINYQEDSAASEAEENATEF